MSATRPAPALRACPLPCRQSLPTSLRAACLLGCRLHFLPLPLPLFSQGLAEL
ncbi:hypothetical protein Celaphus_00001975, partial [Cervus elaphus hippelaphus]